MLYEGKIWLGTGEHPSARCRTRQTATVSLPGRPAPARPSPSRCWRRPSPARACPCSSRDVKGDRRRASAPPGVSTATASPSASTQCGVPGRLSSTARTPTAFWDVYRQRGGHRRPRHRRAKWGRTLLGPDPRPEPQRHAGRASCSILFRVADDEGLLLLDLKDSDVPCLTYVGEHRHRVHARPTATCPRRPVGSGHPAGAARHAGARRAAMLFFGEPALDIRRLDAAR